MPLSSSIDIRILNDGLENPQFKEFVLEYLTTFMRVPDDIDITQVYNTIFSVPENYRNFISYCRDKQFPFVEQWKNENYKTMMFLLAFEQAKMLITDRIVEDVSKILAIWAPRLELEFANAHIPGTNITFMTGLLRSVYNGIPVNNVWELVYFIWEEYGLYKVYSFEHGTYHVDTKWNITEPKVRNNSERRVALTSIQDIQNFIALLQQKDRSEEDAQQFLLWRDIFLFDRSREWRGSKEDILALKLWAVEELRIANGVFDTVKWKDKRKVNISLIST